jgi:diguanylate cyclase
MNEANETTLIKEIQKEYIKIDDKWMKLHFHTLIGLTLVGFVFECILGITLYATGYVEIALLRYALKYILAPLLFNLFFIASASWAVHTHRLRQKQRAYIISLLFVGVCFVIFSIHCIFDSLYLIFTIPILLTVVYSDFALTSATAFVSIAAKIISELFVVWDPDKVFPLKTQLGITNFIISIFILCIFYLVCMIVIRFLKEKNAASIQKEIEYYQVQQKLIIDELTETYNRKGLRNAFENMVEDMCENTYTFVMLDLDNFKTLNDTMGHDKGDQFLIEFSRILKRNCTDGAVPFRFGGDEFCILFSNVELDRVTAKCQNIQSDLKVYGSSIADISLSTSIGIAQYKKNMTATQLLRNTDAALYRSKESKGDICVFEDMDTPDPIEPKPSGSQ